MFKKKKSGQIKNGGTDFPARRRKFLLATLAASGLTVALAVSIIFLVVRAGTLTPSAAPVATSYTLNDIYNRLNTYTAATAGNHAFSPSAAPAATLHTLTEIYNLIPTIRPYLVATSTTYLGVRGTLLGHEFNGTSGIIAGGSQANGGVDDMALAADRYVGRWTLCNSSAYNASTNPGGNYCNTGSSGAKAKDNSTNLVWSKTLNGSTYAPDDSAGTMTWYIANNCVENGSGASTCTKKTSSMTGCEANAGWYVPTQKQAMQAYIDGSYGIVEDTFQYIWSATSLDFLTSYDMNMNLAAGYANWEIKTDANPQRCVREATP